MNSKSIADFIKPTIITAQQYGTKISVELNHSDTELDELMDAFQTIVIGLGYHDSSWKNWIVDRADEYKEEAAEEAMYEPSPELRRAAEEYVRTLQSQQIDEAIDEHNSDEISDWDSTLNDGLDEDEFFNDGGFSSKPNKTFKPVARQFKKTKKK